jgi:hypothetical protein
MHHGVDSLEHCGCRTSERETFCEASEMPKAGDVDGLEQDDFVLMQLLTQHTSSALVGAYHI